VDGGELVEPLARPGNALEELHVHLQVVTGLRLLVPLPALRVLAILLICRKAIHAVLEQKAVHSCASDGNAMEALQVVGDFARAEMVVLPEIQNLAYDVGRRRVRAAKRRSWPIRQASVAVLVVALLPLVEGLSGNAEVPAGARDIAPFAPRSCLH